LSFESTKASVRKRLRAASSVRPFGKNFDDNVSVQMLVVRAVDFAHPAGADEFAHLEVGESLTDHE
jgi:hypothetical protein